jgi:hypothetical protein
LKRQSGGKFAGTVCVVHPPPIVDTAIGPPTIGITAVTHSFASVEDVFA